MKLLKDIAKDRLVIMVTHNPDLANSYSTRIIGVKDGKIVSDSNPYDGNDKKGENKKDKKTNMSFFTALSLSLKNLLTKKGRTILTAFAGSIGIIGISLILSISNGVDSYIDKVQEDTLTSYPLTIERESVDFSNMLTIMAQNNEKKEHKLDAVYSNDIMVDMISNVSSEVRTNNLKDFKEYLNKNKSKLSEYSNDIKYFYNLDLQIYSENTKDGITQLNPSNIMNIISTQMGNYNMGGNANVFQELSDNESLLNNQYEILKGKMPEKYDEMVLILDENNEVSDYTLYSLGLKDQKELAKIMSTIMKGEKVEKNDQLKLNYDDILNTKFKVILNTDYYQKENGIWVDKRTDLNYMKKVVDDALTINIVGIIKPKESSSIETTGVVGYTSELSSYIINGINDSNIAKEQKDNNEINVFTQQKFQIGESYESNLRNLGIVDEEDPYIINIYPKDFESKDKIEEFIKEYNEGKSEEDKIEYTDYVGILMNSVTTIVNVISYVLIAFVSISLIVSSIMIGIITYISVLERTKEIGILRAIGASKKDIRRVFNAETFIVGLIAGLLGVIITTLLNIPINNIITALSGIEVGVNLPFVAGLILVAISMTLTIIAGLIPSKMAAKKDPVVALRTE